MQLYLFCMSNASVIPERNATVFIVRVKCKCQSGMRLKSVWDPVICGSSGELTRRTDRWTFWLLYLKLIVITLRICPESERVRHALLRFTYFWESIPVKRWEDLLIINYVIFTSLWAFSLTGNQFCFLRLIRASTNVKSSLFGPEGFSMCQKLRERELAFLIDNFSQRSELVLSGYVFPVITCCDVKCLYHRGQSRGFTFPHARPCRHLFRACVLM